MIMNYIYSSINNLECSHNDSIRRMILRMTSFSDSIRRINVSKSLFFMYPMSCMSPRASLRYGAANRGGTDKDHDP